MFNRKDMRNIRSGEKSKENLYDNCKEAEGTCVFLRLSDHKLVNAVRLSPSFRVDGVNHHTEAFPDRS